MRLASLSSAAALLLLASPAAAQVGAHHHDDGHAHAVPDRHDDPAFRAAAWISAGDWLQAPAVWPAGGGTRVAALAEIADDGPAPALEARGVSADAAGPWLPLAETFRDPGHRVAVVDLGGHWPGAELRLAAADGARIGDLGWELLVPTYPDAGRAAREAAAVSSGAIYAVDSTLARIGVVSREAWGARPTQCTTLEDSWYRMAIHHTAGVQTSGGTVQGAVRALQAYSQDSGRFCDIPYQYLVGYDGSLWEGRSIAYRSGATGGNNPGNIAVSFLGCYHPSGCPGGNSHTATEPMMTRARLLVQTLARIHGITTGTSEVRGHRDWPGNSTACPGEYVHARLGELRADLAWYAAEQTASSLPEDGEAPVQTGVGEPVEVWVELRNTGGLPWEPGVTFLGTTGPRDAESSLHDPSWPAPNRAASVDVVIAPGETARLSFLVRPQVGGEVAQTFGLVQEQVTWFADAPWGGGPGDEGVVVRVLASGSPDDPDAPGGDWPADDSDRNPGGPVLTGGCAASGGAGGGGALVVLCAWLALSGRRRQRSASARV